MKRTTVSIDEMWDDLQHGVEQIYADAEPLTRARYMTLYTHARNLMNIIDVYDGSRKYHITVYAVYQYVEAFLRNHVSTRFDAAKGITTEDTLRVYTSQWERFKICSKVLSHLLTLENVKWCRKGGLQSTEKVYETYQLALVTWKDVLLSASGAKFIDGVLSLIEDDRRGKPVDTSLIRGVVFSYVELSMIEEKPSNDPFELRVYVTAFESRFLEDTKRFYELLKWEVVEYDHLSEYVKKTQRLLEEEERRVERYLHKSTLVLLLHTLWEVLIANHVEVLYAEFKNLLSEERHDDLASRYRLMSRNFIATSNLAALFEERVSGQALLAVELVGDAVFEDPLLYVDTLMRVYRKYHNIVISVFANHICFVSSLDKACTKFINQNAAAVHANCFRNLPEFYSEYCDTILRKLSEATDDSQLENSFDDVITVLKYIEDKDAFQKCYIERLIKRIAQQLSISEVMEGRCMYRLRTACCHSCFSTLDRMFRDIEASKEVTTKFTMDMRNSGESLIPDFSIHVLTSGLWPFRQPFHLQLPPELEGIVQRFTNFYSGLHRTRKLQWFHNLSKGELVTSGFKENYTIQASTLQMAVVLQYNQRLSFTVHQLQERTDIDVGILLQLLQSLLKSELLTCPQGDLEESGKLLPDTLVSLFEGYHSKEKLVNISEPLEEGLEADQVVTQRMIEDDRKILVEAAIVRIMKIRKALEHQDLIFEVIDLLEPKFKPTETLINECTRKLIEREYLEKDDDQPNTYKYLA